MTVSNNQILIMHLVKGVRLANVSECM